MIRLNVWVLWIGPGSSDSYLRRSASILARGVPASRNRRMAWSRARRLPLEGSTLKGIRWRRKNEIQSPLLEL